MRHLEKLGEVGEEGWPVPEEAWTRLASLKDKKTKKTKDKIKRQKTQSVPKEAWTRLASPKDKRQKTLSVLEEAWTRLAISE